MCFECEAIDKGKRDFLTGATVAIVGAALTPRLFGQTETTISWALNDPNVVHEPVTFKNGADTIKGHLFMITRVRTCIIRRPPGSLMNGCAAF